jgi:hypothetical protein
MDESKQQALDRTKSMIRFANMGAWICAQVASVLVAVKSELEKHCEELTADEPAAADPDAATDNA